MKIENAEQPAQQKPVAWMVDVDLANYQGQSEYRTILAWNAKPVWSGTHEINEVIKAIPLYTSPPQRQPLTYVDLRRIANQCGFGANEVSAQAQAKVDNFARAIEAAHNIKEKT